MKWLVPLATAVLLFAADPQPRGSLVKVANGRVHIHCVGGGDTTVLFVNGVPRFSFHFSLVQQEVAGLARACVYDRVGEAWSDPRPGRVSAEDTLGELDSVVRAVAGERPVVLVGHSFGGVLARAYTRGHPERVRALVLVDSVPLEFAKVRVQGQEKTMAELDDEDFAALATAARSRPQPAFPDPKIESPFDRLPPDLQAAHLWATKKWQESARKVEAADALRYQAAFYRTIENASLAELPLFVIARASQDAPKGWIEAQERIAALSTKGVLLRAEGSGHDIELERPGLVSQAIRQVVKGAPE